MSNCFGPDWHRVKFLSTVGQCCPTALPFDLTELRKVRAVSMVNPVKIQVVVVSKLFFGSDGDYSNPHITHHSPLGNSKNFWFHRQRYIAGRVQIQFTF